jgi:hypothetical protein
MAVRTTLFWCTREDGNHGWLAIADYPRAAIDAGAFDDAGPVSRVTLDRPDKSGNVTAELVETSLLAEIGGRWFEGRPDRIDGGYVPDDDGDVVAAVIPIERVDYGRKQAWDSEQAPPREVVFVRGGSPRYRGFALRWPTSRSMLGTQYFTGWVEHPDFEPVNDGQSADVIEQLLDQVDRYLDGDGR